MKKINFLVVLTISLTFLIACASKKEKDSPVEVLSQSVPQSVEQVDELQSDTGSVTIIEESGDSLALLRYQKTSCYGRCPVYVFQLFSNGDCVLDAKQFYKVEGLHIARLTTQQLDEFSARLKAIDFFRLKDEYNDPKIADVPAILLKVHQNGKTKQVKSVYNVPRKLIEFQMQVEELIDGLNWQKSP